MEVPGTAHRHPDRRNPMTTAETYRGYEIHLEDGMSLRDTRRLIDDKIAADDDGLQGDCEPSGARQDHRRHRAPQGGREALSGDRPRSAGYSPPRGLTQGLPASTLTPGRHRWFVPAMRKRRVSDTRPAAAGRDPLSLARATSSRSARRPLKRGKRDPALGPRLATEIPPRVFPPIRAFGDCGRRR